MTLYSNPSVKRDYTYSYSGADCRAYAWFPEDRNSQPVLLKSMATISISVHEAKSPVRRLGHRGVSGFTEAIRTIAGSIVFTVIEDHPLKHLIESNPGSGPMSLDMRERKLDSTVTLRPMNILLKYQTEVNEQAGVDLEIHNLRFINEGVVTSVNDMVTEMVCQFVAEDAKTFNMTKNIRSEFLDQSGSEYLKSLGEDIGSSSIGQLLTEGSSALYKEYKEISISAVAEVLEKELEIKRIMEEARRVKEYNLRYDASPRGSFGIEEPKRKGME
jgi:hypothetical protein